LLKYIEEEKKFLEITGFRNLNIENSEEFVKTMRKELPKNAWIQFFNAELVATWQHLYFAVLNAMIAFAQKANISKSLAMETMLYASAQRQIQKAIDLMGVKCSSTNIAVLIVGESFESVHAILSVISKRVGKEPEDMVLKISEDKKEKIRNSFEINAVEFQTVMKKDNDQEALVDLVIERIALLSTQL
jgi:KEOPS complex subunit Cgi121